MSSTQPEQHGTSSSPAQRQEAGGTEGEVLSAAARPDDVAGGWDTPEQRAAHAAYVHEQVRLDAQRMTELRTAGFVDDFDPDLAPREAERRGPERAARHMVRLIEGWLLDEMPRDRCIERAARWLGDFERSDNVRKVLFELESHPIRDVYPLEVMLRLVDVASAHTTQIRPASLVGGCAALQQQRLYAGHPVQIPVPKSLRLKSFALLGGARPGYEFFPSSKAGHYTLQIDTAGTYTLALLAVQTEQTAGRLTKELPGGFLERVDVTVRRMGAKGHATEGEHEGKSAQKT
ncbi:MAG: hypothetical protein ACO3JL_19735 [Myxococcota bacterium]